MAETSGMVQEQLQRSMSRSSRHTRALARKLGKLTEVQAAVGWALILLVIALLGVIYLNQSSRIATVGRRVQTLQYDLDMLQRQNADLERDIARAQSITRIEEEAEKLGFVKAQPADIEYMVVPNFPATPSEMREEEASPNARPRPAETMQEGLWLVLQSTVGDLMRGEAHD